MISTLKHHLPVTKTLQYIQFIEFMCDNVEEARKSLVKKSK